MSFRRTAAAIAFVLPLISAAALAQEMTVDFSWSGVPGCQGASVSPAFQVRNVPDKTRSLHFTLIKRGDDREYGGSTVTYPSSGNIPQGAVFSYSPCQPGEYVWTVTALDALGKPLAIATKIRQFPN